MKDLYPLRTLCNVLEISPGGYYSWLDRREHPSPRASQDTLMLGRARPARLMKEQGLQGCQKGRHRIQTTDSDHRQPIAPNRLASLGFLSPVD